MFRQSGPQVHLEGGECGYFAASVACCKAIITNSDFLRQVGAASLVIGGHRAARVSGYAAWTSCAGFGGEAHFGVAVAFASGGGRTLEVESVAYQALGHEEDPLVVASLVFRCAHGSEAAPSRCKLD